MKNPLLTIAVVVGIVLALFVITPSDALAQMPPPPPAPPDQTPVWAPAILMTLGAAFFAIKIMRRKN